MKVMTLVGARPQFIKASIISNELKFRHIEEVLVHSGQHYDKNLSDDFFLELELPTPKYNLNIGSFSHAVQTGKMLIELERAIETETPSLLLVYGDTNTTLAGALAASKLGIPVFHVESGLRCYDKSVPEEINRLLTDHLSFRLFCISESSLSNLEKEGITDGVILSGDIMYDLYLTHKHKVGDDRMSNIIANYFPKGSSIENLEYNLVTIHRQENTFDSYVLLDLLNKINRSKFKSVFPIHPRTFNIIKNDVSKFANIIFIKPVGYIDMLTFIRHCRKVVTDSGGVLREAYFSNKPTVTIRSSLEIKETLINKANILCGNDSTELTDLIDLNLETITNRFFPFYGDGNASKIIVDEISKFLDQVRNLEKT